MIQSTGCVLDEHVRILFDTPFHRFDLAIQLGDLDTAYGLAKESGSEQKWKQLAELATNQAKFDLAQQCLHEAQVGARNVLKLFTYTFIDRTMVVFYYLQPRQATLTW